MEGAKIPLHRDTPDDILMPIGQSHEIARAHATADVEAVSARLASLELVGTRFGRTNQDWLLTQPAVACATWFELLPPHHVVRNALGLHRVTGRTL